MEDNIAIKVEHLSKVYKMFDKPIDRLKESLHPFRKRYSTDFYALNDISFEIKKGETVGIIGKNGAGKSTLLKIITGVLMPTTGTIQVNGRIASLLELGAGFNPEMTGIENIYLTGTIMGYSKAEMDDRLQNIIDFADIGDFMNQPVKMYSSGMFARLAFAVNAYVEPDILIVDEALSVGDVAFQAKCISRMKQMMKLGVTILFVTHDMSTVKSFCVWGVYLDHGCVKIQGNAEDVADVYLREMRDEMNCINKEIKHNLSNEHFLEEKCNTSLEFKVDYDFQEKVSLFRQGSGKAKIMAFEVLDLGENPILEAAFNQQILLRIYLQFFDDLEVAVGYHIRDDKNIEILGSSLRLESNKLLLGKNGEKYIIDFITRVPLMEGMYNVTLVVSTPTDKHGESVIFSDLIENSYVFKVNRQNGLRLWNKVYIPIEYNLHFVGNEKFYNKKCSCCSKDNIHYLPLPEYYSAEQKKYGVLTKPRPEMVNFTEYSCSNCGAADRDRAYAAWMKNELPNDKKINMLDIAPAVPLKNFIRENFPLAKYKTGDLFMEGVDYKLDVMNMYQIKDDSIDFFICSHVLEHVRDDIKAMKEFKRILKKDGKGILVVPIDLKQQEIDEDPDCDDIGERWRRFGQDDHIRKYSRQGYINRVKSVGLKIEEYKIDYFGEKIAWENSLLDTSTVYIVSK